MKKFRTALFNGYQKNAVDEYLEDLMQELEVLRQDAFKAQSAGQLRTQLEEIRQENERLQESLQEKSRKLEEEAEQKQLLISEHEKQLSNEKQRLEDIDRELRNREQQLKEKELQLQQLKEKELQLQQLQQQENAFKEERQRLASLNDQYAEKEEKLKRYENDYSSFMDLMVNMKSQARQIVTDAQSDAEEILLMAKKDADEITSSAQSEAEKITDRAKLEALDYRENVEKELKKRKEDESLKFQLARFRISEYLESLNRSQNRLISVYEEFGRLVGQLPLRLGDVFSDEPFELLDDPEKSQSESSSPKKDT